MIEPETMWLETLFSTPTLSAMLISKNIESKNLKEFLYNTLNIYVKPSKEVYKQFVSFEMFINLCLLKAFRSRKYFKDNHLQLFFSPWRNIFKVKEHEDISRPWQEFTLLGNEILEPERFWNISQEECGDKLCFLIILELIKSLL